MKKENPMLHLNLKSKWFDMILSGEKKEEYREMTEYWERYFIKEWNLIRLKKELWFPNFIKICFSNGYNKDRRQIIIQCEDLHIGYGKEEWGAIPDKKYFVLSLGEIIEKRNTMP